MRDKDNVLVSSIVCLKLPFSMTNTLGAAENINYRTRKNFKDDSILPDSLLQNTKVELLRKKKSVFWAQAWQVCPLNDRFV